MASQWGCKLPVSLAKGSGKAPLLACTPFVAGGFAIRYRIVLTLVLAACGCLPAFGRDLSLAEAEQLVARGNRDVLAARRAIEAAGAGISPRPT